ncbi:28S ribosomal protein s14, mitochondrial [Plakobranchus ocellatus]|uniref:28S ribosomal protein s14, mitochondrial n=1 Tax=Plakobranchus ocellatus TaxID=259542 RepID=A0AAV4AD57_9GAST|nr:28S ribosomal protein s14, mitochondrial [Plakobranchus ocellatus]
MTGYSGLQPMPLTARLSVSPVLSVLSTPGSVNTAVPSRSKSFDHHFLNRWMARDYKRRVMLKKYTPLRQRYVAMKRCSVLPKEIQEIVSQEIHEFPRDSCYSRAHRRCILTSRPRWCIHKYRISRIQWRLLADYNKLSGVTRATW